MKIGRGKVRLSIVLLFVLRTACFLQFDLNSYRDSSEAPVISPIVSIPFLDYHSMSLYLGLQ
jgi:hypothetical protein